MKRLFHCILILLVILVITCCSISSIELKLAYSNVDNLGNDGDFIPLKGNWLNFPLYSMFKFSILPRNQGLRMKVHTQGFIIRNSSTYQINSKTLVMDEKTKLNISHYFDSSMQQYSTELCSGLFSLCHKLPETDSNIPFHLILNSYENHSYLIKDHVKIFDTVSDNLCNREENDLIVSSFHEQHFLLCLRKGKREVSALRYIVGREFIASVEQLEPTSSEIISNMFKNDLPKFPNKKKDFKVRYQHDEMIPKQTHHSAYFLNSESHACILPWLKGSNCRNSSLLLKRATTELKRCVFLHGYGTSFEHSGHPVYSSDGFRNGEYWGQIDHYTPYCSERIFMREESNNRGWNNLDLQMAVSKILVPDFVSNKKNIVRNTIIIAHSMGNLMVAGAIKRGLIDIDMKSTTWYNIMGPILGSPLADFGVRVCESGFSNYAVDIGLCESYGKPTGALESLAPSSSLKYDISPIISKYVSGSMCGTKSSGLNPFSPLSLAMVALSPIMSQWTHDGAVPLFSCRNELNADAFSEDYHARNYRVSANHFDGTCAYGDGWFDSSSPCSFYLNKF